MDVGKRTEELFEAAKINRAKCNGTGIEIPEKTKIVFGRDGNEPWAIVMEHLSPETRESLAIYLLTREHQSMVLQTDHCYYSDHFATFRIGKTPMMSASDYYKKAGL